jgi:hypothetical protein
MSVLPGSFVSYHSILGDLGCRWSASFIQPFLKFGSPEVQASTLLEMWNGPVMDGLVTSTLRVLGHFAVQINVANLIVRRLVIRAALQRPHIRGQCIQLSLNALERVTIHLATTLLGGCVPEALRQRRSKGGKGTRGRRPYWTVYGPIPWP